MGFQNQLEFFRYMAESKVWAGCRKVQFVGDWGDDTWEGTSVEKPVTTLLAALANCSKYGYNRIYCIQNPQDTTYPIDVNVENVHIIGFPWVLQDTVRIVPPANTAGLSISKSKVTIEGLHIGAGVDHGGIEWDASRHHTTIKNCMFGHVNMTGKYGLYTDVQDLPYLVVTGCIFGNGLTSHGIHILNATRGFIGMPEHGNIFRLTQGGKGINVHAGSGHDMAGIFDNRLSLHADTKGLAITLVAAGGDCFIDGNRANHGRTAMAANPYLDTGSGNWGLNYKAGVSVMPAIA